MNGILLVVIVSSLIITMTVGANGLDRTLESGASGVDVVRAVIAKIETSNTFLDFQPNKTAALFMRTMAYVETRDGNETNSTGGGIWKIDKALFESTQKNVELDSVIMKLQLEHPQNYVGPVNWINLTYADLSFPLYSGLAVRMLIHLNGSLPEYSMNAAYWNDVFKGSRSNLNIVKWNDGVAHLATYEGMPLQCYTKLEFHIVMLFIISPTVCRQNIDLVFVLDESGSVKDPNFQKIKTFVYNFSQSLLTNMTTNRVGVITFSTEAIEHIALNNTIEDNKLLELIRNLSYVGGSTNTAVGLELMRQQDWSNKISVLRLAIVLTDEVSNFIFDTRTAAIRIAAQAVHAHDPPILVYAIGVGRGTDHQELETIASGREFVTHLDSFDPRVLESTHKSYLYQICYTGKYNNVLSNLSACNWLVM